ncbi:MAG: hypothetical protein LBC92_01620 [Rickettsiales bacterium]|nr:hypothetical protein [Rickettsiales bacterium]
MNHLVNGNQWKQRTQQGLNLRHNVLNNISNLFSGASKHKNNGTLLTFKKQQIENDIKAKKALLQQSNNAIRNVTNATNPHNNNNVTTMSNGNKNNQKSQIKKELNKLYYQKQKLLNKLKKGLNLRHQVLNNLTNLLNNSVLIGSKKMPITNNSNGLLPNINNLTTTQYFNNRNTSASGTNVSTLPNNNTINNKSQKKLNRGVVGYEYYKSKLNNKYDVRFDVENMQDGTKQLYNFNVIDNNTGDVFNQDDSYNREGFKDDVEDDIDRYMAEDEKELESINKKIDSINERIATLKDGESSAEEYRDLIIKKQNY